MSKVLRVILEVTINLQSSVNPTKEFYTVVLKFFNLFERKSFSIYTLWYFTHLFTCLTNIFQSLLDVKSVQGARDITVQDDMRLVPGGSNRLFVSWATLYFGEKSQGFSGLTPQGFISHLCYRLTSLPS